MGRPKGYNVRSNKRNYLDAHCDENGELPPRKKGRKTPEEKENLLHERYEEELRLWKLRLKNNEELHAGVIRLGDCFYFDDSPALVEPSLPTPEETKGEWKKKNIVKSLNVGFTKEEYEFVEKESERLHLSKNDFLKMKIFTYMYRKPSTMEKRFYEETPRFPYFSNQNRLKSPRYKRHYYDVKHRGEVYGRIGEGTPEAIEAERQRIRKWEREEMMRKEEENRARNPIWYARRDNLQAMEEYDINERGSEGVHYEEFTQIVINTTEEGCYRYVFKEDNPILFKVYSQCQRWIYSCKDYGIEILTQDNKKTALNSAKMKFHYIYRFLFLDDDRGVFRGEITCKEKDRIRGLMRDNMVKCEWGKGSSEGNGWKDRMAGEEEE